MTDGEIRQELLRSGWPESQIVAAFASLDQPPRQSPLPSQPQEPRRRKFPVRLVVYPFLLFLIALFSPQWWPYMETRLGYSPKADRVAAENPVATSTLTPSPSSGLTVAPSTTPAQTEVPSRLQQFLAERDAIGAYLPRQDVLIVQFQQNTDKVTIALKNKSLAELAERKKESERISGEWKLVLPPARLVRHHGLIRGAFEDDVTSLEFTIEFLQTKDIAKVTQAAEFSDSTAQKLEQANTEMRRVMTEVQKDINSLSVP